VEPNVAVVPYTKKKKARFKFEKAQRGHHY
jgi:hypothetical protein